MLLDTPKSLPVPKPVGKSKGRVLDSAKRSHSPGGTVEAADTKTLKREQLAKAKKSKALKLPSLIKTLTNKKILDAQKRLLKKQQKRQEKMRAFVKQKAKLGLLRKS
ncbi:hypothetical protein Daus18300_012383 [Diaporthe australafricana]|uniref:ALMS motif domain-containing protein n=1 Tax=Diaporthe australafricana TaxID=127596 RepID=A0ABR3W380_9PEZI